MLSESSSIVLYYILTMRIITKYIISSNPETAIPSVVRLF